MIKQTHNIDLKFLSFLVKRKVKTIRLSEVKPSSPRDHVRRTVYSRYNSWAATLVFAITYLLVLLA